MTNYPCHCRRQFLVRGAAAVLGAFSLPGCGERTGAAQALTPGEIEAGTSCELDGMLLADYPGPKAQVHYAGQTAPVFFCDTVELFNTLLQPEQVRKADAVFVQDMALANWNQPQGHWIDARTALYVLGSKRHGSMGPTLASFAQAADAQLFIQQWGGRQLRFDEVRPEMVDLSGGGLHDAKM